MDQRYRETIETRLAQARRLAREPVDEVTKERLQALVQAFEEQLAEVDQRS